VQEGPAPAAPEAALPREAASDDGLAAPAPPPPPAGDGAALDAAEEELLARRTEIVRMEERALREVESVEVQLRDLERRRQSLDDRERNLDHDREELKKGKRQHLRELERIAGLSPAQARQILLKEVENEARHQAGLTLQRIDEETKLEAERRARGILAVAMQRLAAAQAGQTTTTCRTTR
jgi:ribonuclease Y